MIRALEGKEIVQNAELLIRRTDGSQRSVLAGSSPVLDAGGQVVSGVSIFQDITERKQADEKLQASNDELRRFNKAMVGRELRMVELKTKSMSYAGELASRR